MCLAFGLLLATSPGAHAQTSTGTIVYMKTSLASTSLSDTGDIATNATDTVRFYLNASNTTNFSIQIYAAYISGTTPDLTCFLEESNFGTIWDRRQAAFQSTGDTLNLDPLSGISAHGTLAVSSNCAQYYRVSCHGHKTQSVGLKAAACLRKDARY